jgi:hypothetical protein
MATETRACEINLAQMSAPLREEGPQRFARWNAALFEAVVQGPAAVLAAALAGQPDAEAVLSGYLRMIQQGIGTGALRQATAAAARTTFLERCLIELIPALLPEVKPGWRLPLLVAVWNLGEGLLREPAWLDRYVTACAGRLRHLNDVEGFLMRTLEPVLASSPPSSWKGPFAVSVLDLRPVHEDFLPGEIALAAPTVLRVEDRQGSGMQMGILLRRDGKSELLGLTDGLADYREAGNGVCVAFQDGSATLAGQKVELPFLRRCQGHVIAQAGFVAACAVDSQRLWIVESAG